MSALVILGALCSVLAAMVTIYRHALHRGRRLACKDARAAMDAAWKETVPTSATAGSVVPVVFLTLLRIRWQLRLDGLLPATAYDLAEALRRQQAEADAQRDYQPEAEGAQVRSWSRKEKGVT